ncbi:MAG: hypothetical protein IJY62_05865 [Clostridia bacterium]|nr:hypothetical protein [Clostridia bacterium]
MEYIVKAAKLTFGFSVFRSGEVESVSASYLGKPFIEGMNVLLNGEKVTPVLEQSKTEGNLLFAEFSLKEGVRFTLEVLLGEDYFEDNIRFASKIPVDSFEFMWVFCEAEGSVRPIPFQVLGKQPHSIDFSFFEGNAYQQRYEGVFVNFASGRQMTVLKEPNDDEPVFVRLRKEENMLIGSAYFDVDKTVEKVEGNTAFHEEFVGSDEADAVGYARYRLTEDPDEDDKSFKDSPKAVEIGFYKTRYRFGAGESVEQAFAYYRDFMAAHGVKEPENYVPMTNYCIYYDISELPTPDGFEAHAMNEEIISRLIDVAHSVHCTTLYTDQGWDTSYGSLIWDEARMGKIEDTIARLEEKGMNLGLLVGMHMAAKTLPDEALRRGKDGKVVPGNPWHKYGWCAASPIGKKIYYERMKALADKGVKFFSFDGHDNFRVRCYGKNHGHSLPLTHYEHAWHLNDLQAKLKATCPNLIIEAHDWVDAGGYYYPIYMFGNGHHERWGFEYMWKPYADYSKGWTENLYYYRLAYRMPMYLHMNLAGAGENAEVFWYYASTVQHVGIGNFERISPELQKTVQAATGVFAKYRYYFYGEEFTGKGPMCHIHKKEGAAVICLFNSEANKCGVKSFTFEELGVPVGVMPKVVWGNAEILPDSGGFSVVPKLKESDCAILTINA